MSAKRKVTEKIGCVSMKQSIENIKDATDTIRKIKQELQAERKKRGG